MKLTAKADIQIACSRDAAFRYLTDCNATPEFMQPLFPLAGIESSALISADEPAAGVRRTVRLSDGTVIEETIDEWKVPSVHGYAWGPGLKPPLSMIVRHAAARWDFEESDQGTHVRWSYEFTLTSPITWPVAKPVFLRFQTWMGKGLQRARTHLESG